MGRDLRDDPLEGRQHSVKRETPFCLLLENLQAHVLACSSMVIVPHDQAPEFVLGPAPPPHHALSHSPPLFLPSKRTTGKLFVVPLPQFASVI